MSSNKEFKLSKTLYGHSLDVRSVVVTPNGDLISGSRDKTAKFWRYEPLRGSFEEVMTYRDQKNFVACVLYLDPTEEFPNGLVVTGGNDNIILVYKPSEPFATFTIKEHTNTVSCLGRTTESNMFLSGSWDTTGKCFKIASTPKCVVSFIGHTAAIWSIIQLRNGQIVTASADKTLGVWNSTGQKLLSLSGHTDCVRSVTDFPELGTFVSVANDAAIKVWSYTGENINTYYGHSSYIYSIAKCRAAVPDAFVTSDEDRTVKYWENGENLQSITLPAQSVWSVDCLPNGDVVTGSSDGVIRVFTRDKSRFADEGALTKFTEDVAALERQSLQEIGGVKVSDLPGTEALYDPGKKSGQMKMIRESGKVVAYTWISDGDNSHWEKVGDVMGGTDKEDSGKTVFEGKAYDFVFSVDVEDGKPPLKLPYNKGEDVYQTAHAFITKNFLPAEYLEQIVDFILKNSKEQYVPPTNNAYQDPFTGGSRYTPSYQDTNTSMGVNVDPLTGGASYSTNGAPKSSASSTSVLGGNTDPFTGDSSYSTTPQNTLFPVKTYRTFDTGDPEVIIKKIKEFNSKLSEDFKLPENELEALGSVCQGPSSDPATYELLFRLLDWPEDVVFPALDVVRMAIRDPTNNEVLVASHEGAIFGKIMRHIKASSNIPNNVIVALRAVCNFCLHEAGESLVFDNRFDIVEDLTSLSRLNKNGQIALATLLLNLTILCGKKSDDLWFSVLAQVLPDVITKLTELEAHFRGYLAVGTLIAQANANRVEIVAKINENQEFLRTLQLYTLGCSEAESKRSSCAKQLQLLL
ncbi:phospholipase A-2-activating protein [Euwallacea similis]|uniref:phospholipase A-2-activating protein n=1 Tax=Euwallacea similis TaxID=1736056 RepID=UPI00344E84BF